MIANQTRPKTEIFRREIRDRAGRTQAVVRGFGSAPPARPPRASNGGGGGSPAAGRRDPLIDSVQATPAQSISSPAVPVPGHVQPIKPPQKQKGTVMPRKTRKPHVTYALATIQRATSQALALYADPMSGPELKRVCLAGVVDCRRALVFIENLSDWGKI